MQLCGVRCLLLFSFSDVGMKSNLTMQEFKSIHQNIWTMIWRNRHHSKTMLSLTFVRKAFIAETYIHAKTTLRDTCLWFNCITDFTVWQFPTCCNYHKFVGLPPVICRYFFEFSHNFSKYNILAAKMLNVSSQHGTMKFQLWPKSKKVTVKSKRQIIRWKSSKEKQLIPIKMR